MKDNMRRQVADAKSHRYRVLYSPLGQSKVKAADKAGMAAILRKKASSLRKTYKRSTIEARLLGGTACVSLLWTTRFARIVGVPPLVFSKAYKESLRRRLLATRSNGQQIANTAIVGTAKRSFKGAKTKRRAIAQCNRLIRTMEKICSRATGALRHSRDPQAIVQSLAVRGLPASGYLSSLFSSLWKEVSPKSRKGTPPSIPPVAKGTCQAIARLTGDRPTVLFSNRVLLSLRLKAICDIWPSIWRAHGPNIRRPTGRADELAVQLCQWKRDKFGVKVQDLQVIHAAIGKIFAYHSCNEQTAIQSRARIMVVPIFWQGCPSDLLSDGLRFSSLQGVSDLITSALS